MGWQKAGGVGPEPSGDPLHRGQFGGDGISQLCKGSCFGNPDPPRYPSRTSSAQKTFSVGRFECGNGSCADVPVRLASREMLPAGAVCHRWKNESRNCQIKPRESLKSASAKVQVQRVTTAHVLCCNILVPGRLDSFRGS